MEFLSLSLFMMVEIGIVACYRKKTNLVMTNSLKIISDTLQEFYRNCIKIL
jgi:TRAP-type C4-dicarboxylate transport system permease small subunit